MIPTKGESKMKMPDVFVKKVIGAFGETGQQFLEGLDEKLNTYKEKWSLTILGHFDNLSYNYVAKAINQEGMPVIIKLGVPGYDFTNEAKTVRAYGGNGFVSLIDDDVDNGAMLLNRLLPGRMLFEESEDVAIEEFVKVWKAIRRPVPQTEWNFPTILQWSNGLDRYLESFPKGDGPISEEWVMKAKTFFIEITDTSEEFGLLHGDLHHENILLSEDGWMAIDPKGVIGDQYFDLTSFLVNHLFEVENPKELFEYRVNKIVSLLGLDMGRFLKSSFAMSVLYACWSVEDHDEEGLDNTLQCSTWLLESIKRTFEL